MSCSKFGVPDGDVFVPYTYQPSYYHEQTIGTNRLVIAPASDQVNLLRELSRLTQEPFGILYVLVISRLDSQEARYQCPEPLTRTQMEAFLFEFHDFFESDARHHVWITSLPDKATLVYDNHNLIYAYGPLQRFAGVLRQQGLKEIRITVPSPHAHRYHPEFDASEAEVLSYWKWKTFPLAEQDLQ
jgi:hypothetical protein